MRPWPTSAISYDDQSTAAVSRVRSATDVENIRKEFRRVYALVRNTRPNGLHVFVAAPPSVCFAIGQELSLRSELMLCEAIGFLALFIALAHGPPIRFLHRAIRLDRR
jgi:hypothetical protein